jgi:glyoxylase-like metal-dependent hydrolase (beta-lactamase superfamily II)
VPLPKEPAPAPATPPPPFATTKVEGTENVYVFRAGGHQSMFVVTSAGVIATDPIGYGRPQMVQTYVDEIKKVTNQPIKWVIYSHHHFDHIAGGKPFKDAGAKFLAHKRAAERQKQINDPHTVLPDETMGDKKTKLGDTTLELTYLGLNHSDSTIVMRLPKEKVLFAVDFINVGTFPGRGFIDAYPLEWEDAEEGHGDGLRQADPRSSRPAGWPPRHQGRRAEDADAAAGCLRGGEGRGPGGRLLGQGREGAEAAQVRDLARLRERPADGPAPLLRPLGPRYLMGGPAAPRRRAA